MRKTEHRHDWRAYLTYLCPCGANRDHKYIEVEVTEATFAKVGDIIMVKKKKRK